jgi:hypothetical protein
VEEKWSGGNMGRTKQRQDVHKGAEAKCREQERNLKRVCVRRKKGKKVIKAGRENQPPRVSRPRATPKARFEKSRAAFPKNRLADWEFNPNPPSNHQRDETPPPQMENETRKT